MKRIIPLFLILMLTSAQVKWEKFMCCTTAPSCAAASTTAYTNFIVRSGSLGTDDCNYKTLFSNLTTHGFFNSDGTTSKICFLYIFAAPAQATALLDLSPNAHNGTTTGTVSFSAHNGFTGDALTFFIDTGVAPANCENISGDNLSVGYYGLTSRTTGSNTNIGATDNIHYTYLLNFAAGPNIQADLLSGGFSSVASGGANADGMWIATTVAAPNINIYHNASGTDLGPLSGGFNGSNTTRTTYIFAQNVVGVATTLSSDQLSAAIFCAGLTSAQYLNLQSDINTFMTAYAINIY